MRCTFYNIAVCVAVSFQWIACGSSTGGTSSEAPLGPTDTTFEYATFVPSQGFTHYAIVPPPGGPYERLHVQFKRHRGDPTPDDTGTYSLVGSTTGQCILSGPVSQARVCVWAYADCNGSDCAKVYLADSGTVELTSIGTVGHRFAATIQGAVLRQVGRTESIAPLRFLADGETISLGEYSFDTEILTDDFAPDQCVPGGTGYSTGDYSASYLNNGVADFELTNCNGDTIRFHDQCGAIKARWLMLVAGWCSACEAAVPIARQRVASMNDPNLELMFILGENASHLAADQNYCHTYAARHGIDPSTLYWDPKFSTFIRNVYYYPGSGGVYSLPLQAIFRGSNMEYVYSSMRNSQAAFDSTLNGLLAE